MQIARAVVVAAGIVFAVNACVAVRTGPATKVVVDAPLTAPPQLPLPSAAPAAPQPAPPTTVVEPLPFPIAIPDDSYADEPVVEYGSIEIPKIGLSHATYEGVTLHNIDEGPSHWPGTAHPGQRGNAVFAGHRVTHSHPFRRVDELEPGDEVIFKANGVRSVYRVTATMVVWPDATWIADQTSEPTATLYACHPPGSAAQRYVVQMALASAAPDAVS